MKKTICVILTLCMLLSIIPFHSSAVDEQVHPNYEYIENQIMILLDARQALLMCEDTDEAALRSINQQLEALNVEFLSANEVAQRFPDAYSQQYLSESTNPGSNNRGVTPPSSNLNTWTTYRFENYYYNGKYYNIQKLIAQPISEQSPLWQEGAKTVSFSLNWTAGVTNLMVGVAKAGVSATSTIASWAFTVYDILASTFTGLQTQSKIDPGDVIYRWENSTTAVFHYVRLENQSDNYQELVLIDTRCTTSVAFIVDVDAWSVGGNGAMVPLPEQKTGTKTFSSVPSSFNSTTNACYAYTAYLGGPIKNIVGEIVISGPESKSVVTIHPIRPEFPLHCE